MIKNTNDLRTTYSTLRFAEQMRREHGSSDKIDGFIRELKRDIRDYQNTTSDRRYICCDIDSYIAIIEVPEGVENVDDWFDEEERLVCRPSQYDCTGQQFTEWYKLAVFHGQRYVYHQVGIDF